MHKPDPKASMPPVPEPAAADSASIGLLFANARWAAVLLTAPAIVAFALYLSDLAPTVHWSDTAELQRVVSTLDLPHPTGYPLYLLVGKFWTSALPLHDVAWRANLMSAVTASVAVALATLLVWRLSGRVVGALTTGFVLALTPSFWSQAIVAEVYGLHAVLILLILLSATARHARLWLVALLVGLALAHHRMTVLVLPGVAWAIHARRSDFRFAAKDLLKAGAALAVGLTPYLLTWWQVGWDQPSKFVDHVLHTGEAWWSASEIGDYLIDSLWPIARQQLGVIGPTLAIAGLVWCTKRCRGSCRAAGGMLGVSWLLSIAFFTLYRVPDAFALATHFLLLNAVAIGLGVAAVLQVLSARLSQRGQHVAAAAVAAVVALVLAYQAPGARASASLPDDEWTYPRDRALHILRDTGGGAVLAADYLLGETILYLQDVEGLRPDVHTVVHDRDPEWARGLLEQGRPVYLWGTGWLDEFADDPSVGLIAAEHDRFDEGLYRLVRAEAPADGANGRPALAGAHTEPFGDADARLGQLTIRPWPLVADSPAYLELCWDVQPDELLAETGLRLSVDFDTPWFTHDFGALEPADTAGCATTAFVVPPAPTGIRGTGVLTLYDAGSGSDVGQLATLDVPVQSSTTEAALGRTRHMLPVTGEFATPGMILDGILHPATTHPGIDLPVESAWWVAAESLPLQDVQLELRDSEGNVVSSARVNPTLDSYESRVGDSALVGVNSTLAIPRRMGPGLYELSVGLPEVDPASRVSSVVVEAWDRLWSLPDVERQLDATLADGSIELKGADLGVEGTTASLALYWKAVHETDRDWKVFAHVLGADGAVIAQADGYPGEGMRWTDGWRAGEIIVDRHTIELPPGVDPVRSRILVGLYDPTSSGARASAFRADGSQWPDFAVDIGTLGAPANPTAGSGTDVLESAP